MPEGNVSKMQFELVVNEEQWQRVESLDRFGLNDKVYTVVRDENGKSSVNFGDGIHGSRLPTGRTNIVATYRSGMPANGVVDDWQSISLNLVSESFRKNGIVGVVIECKVDSIVFRPFRKSEMPYKWKWIVMLYRKIKRGVLRQTCRSN